MRPFETETVACPSPNPATFHANLGPPTGHRLSSPVSAETPSRLGPRNWGESAASAGIERQPARERKVTHVAARESLPWLVLKSIRGSRPRCRILSELRVIQNLTTGP